MEEDGPDECGMFHSVDPAAGFLPPDRLRRLLLRLVDSEPLKRPTAQEAAQELREIRDS
jgi:hypothetical protein